MSVHMECLGEILELSGRERAGSRELPIMSITMHDGLIDQAQRFKKRIASKEISGYKVVGMNELVVGFPIDEGVLGFQRKYQAAAVSPAYDVWRVRNAASVDLDYLEKYLRSPQAINSYRLRMRSAVSRRRVLAKDDFRGLKIPCPPIDEQRRIAGILNKLEALRDKRGEAIARLDHLLQSVFIEMFGDVSANDSGWPEVEFGELVESTKLGLVRGASEFGDSPDFDVPYIRMDAISRNGQFIAGKVKRTNAAPKELEGSCARYGDLLFNTRNSKELVGKSAIFDLDSPWAFNNNIMRIRFGRRANAFYILRYLMSRRGQMELERRKSGTTNVFAVYYKDLKTLPVVLPPEDLQGKFRRVVEGQRRLRARMLEHADKAQGFVNTLQQAAFSGLL